ncbi:Hypothetical predicted protein [Xyrichtys novacula]|nr:Hypothetical predicted protein [Xyrichtys novacula]
MAANPENGFERNPRKSLKSLEVSLERQRVKLESGAIKRRRPLPLLPYHLLVSIDDDDDDDGLQPHLRFAPMNQITERRGSWIQQQEVGEQYAHLRPYKEVRPLSCCQSEDFIRLQVL